MWKILAENFKCIILFVENFDWKILFLWKILTENFDLLENSINNVLLLMENFKTVCYCWKILVYFYGKSCGGFAMNVRQQIKLACDVAGISVTELGRQMGMSQQSISNRMKTGKFTKEEFERMADILGCEYIAVFKFPNGTII